MPQYKVTVPNKGSFDVNSDVPLSDAQAYAEVLRQLSVNEANVGMGAALKQGVESTGSSLYTGIQGLLGNPNEAATAGLEREKNIAFRYPDQTSLDRLKDVYQKQGLFAAAKEAGHQLPLMFAEQAPNLGVALGSAAAGARLGALAGPEGALLGGVGGGLAGILAPGALQGYSGNIEKQAATQQAAGQPVNINQGAAIGTALAQAPLMAAAHFIPLGGSLVSKLTGIPTKALLGDATGTAAALAEEKLSTVLAKGVAKGAAIDIPSAVLTQMLTRQQAGLPLTDEDALKEYGSTAYSIAPLSILGGVGRLSERSNARDIMAKKAADEAAANAAVEKQKQDAAQAAQDAAQDAAQAAQDAADKQAAAEQAAYRQSPQFVTDAEQKYTDLQSKINDLTTTLQTKVEPTDLAGAAARKEARDQLRDLKKDPATAKIVQDYRDAQKLKPAPAAPVAPPMLALPAPTVETPAPAPAPAPAPLQTLMTQHDALQKQSDALATQLQQAGAAGDTATHTALLGQYKDIEEQRKAAAALIEQQGGVAGYDLNKPPEEFTGGHMKELDKLAKDIVTATKAAAKAGEDGEFAVQNKALNKIDALKAQQKALLEDIENRRNAIKTQQAIASTGVGETMPLFTKGEAPPSPAGVETPFVTERVRGLANQPSEAKPLPRRARALAEETGPTTPNMFDQLVEQDRVAELARKQAKEKAEAVGVGETVPLFSEEEAPLPKPDLEDVAPQQWNTVKETNPTEVLEGRSPKRPWAQEEHPTTPAKFEQTPFELGLFSDANVIRTDIDNGKYGQLNNIERAKAKEARTQSLNAKAAEQRRLMEVLEHRLNLAGLKTTRSIFHDVNFYTKEKGDDAYEAAMARIQELKDSIEKKGKAKKSVLQEALDAFTAREKYGELLKNGVMPLLTPEGKPSSLGTWLKGIEKAHNRTEFEKQLSPKHVLVTEPGRAPRLVEEKAPRLKPGEFTGVKPMPPLSMKDQVNALAAQKRGATELSRPLTKNEIRIIQNKFDAADRAYNKLFTGKIEPANKEMLEIYRQMHHTEEVEPASHIAARKEAAVEELGRSQRTVSEEAQTKKRINEGDVEKEAAASQAMQEVARKAGLESPVHRDELERLANQLKADINEYSELEVGTGKRNGPAVDAANDHLDAIAIKEGVKTDAYKEALAKATARLREALSYSKQESASRRTEQVVRKVTVEPTTMRTGSEESKEGATTTKVKRAATSAEISPNRKPVIGKSPEIEAPAQEETPRSATDKRAPITKEFGPRIPKAGEIAVEPTAAVPSEETPAEMKARLKAAAEAAKKVLVKENARLATFRKELADLETELKVSETRLQEEQRQGRGTPTLELVREYQSRIANQKNVIKEQLRVVTDAQTTYTDAVNESISPTKPVAKPVKPVETKPVETKPAETKPAETKPAETKPAETKPAETKPAETKPVETKPVETKPVETKPAAAPTSNAQRDQAKHNAKHIQGGTLAWVEGDLSLIRAPAKGTGEPVYLPFKKETGSTIDISTYKGDDIKQGPLLSTQEKATLLEAKNRLETEAAAKHAQKPFLAFDARGLSVSEHVPEKLVSVVAGWKKLLGLDVNIHLTTFDDLKANKENYTGPHRSIIVAVERGSEGYAKSMSDGSYGIVLKPRASITEMLEILAHELGHVHQYESYEKASPETKAALTKAYEDWRDTTQKMSGPELTRAARPYKIGKTLAKTAPEKIGVRSLMYLTSFKEWYADNTAKWAMSSAKPQGIVEKFFSKLGAVLRNFYKSLKGKGYLPDETFRQYIDKLVENPENAPFPDTAKQQTLGGMEGEAMMRASAAVNPALKSAADFADKIVARDMTLKERYKDVSANRTSLMLEWVTRMVDQFAPVVKLSELMPSQEKAMHMMHELRMTQQRSNLLSVAVSIGAIERTKVDGGYLYLAKKGANLVDINKRLGDANTLTGSSQTTNSLFSLYSIAKRAANVGLDRMNYSPEITEAKLKQAMNDIKAVPGLEKIFNDAHEQYQEFNRQNIQFAVDTGYLSKDLADKMLKNKDYVPYYRENARGDVELLMGKETIAHVGNVKDQPYLHSLIGGNERIVDFNSAAVRNADMLLEMGMRNQAMRGVANNLQDLGMAKIFKGKATASPETFNFKYNGEDYSAKVESAHGVPAALLVKGLEGIPVQTSAFLKFMGIPTRLLRTMFVANPISAARILFKDTISSSMTSGSNLDTVGKALKTAKDGLLSRSGIAGGELFQGLPEDMANILREIQTGKTGWEQLLAKGHLLHAKADLMTREIRFQSYLKQGLNTFEAANMALESMNFTRRGISPSIHILNTLNPFINSQIQGISTLIRSLTGKMPMNEKLQIQKKVMQRGLLLAGSTVLYTMAMQDDKKYKDATPEQKYNNFFMPFPGLDEPFRIPIPFEAGLLFKAIPEALINMMYGNADAAEGMKMALKRLVPGGDTYGVPQMLRPAIETGLGKSFYTGRDIESRHEQSLEPGKRVRPTTSAAAAELGDMLGISPIKIDNLINGYTGSLGMTIAKLSNAMVFGPSETAEPPSKHLSENPWFGSVFQPQHAGEVLNDVYNMTTEAKQVHATYQDMISTGRPKEAAEYLKKNTDKMAVANTVASAFDTQMKNYNDRVKAIIQSKTITPDEKRQKIDDIKGEKQDFAEKMRERIKQTEERTKPQ